MTTPPAAPIETAPFQSISEAILSATGPLGFDADEGSALSPSTSDQAAVPEAEAVPEAAPEVAPEATPPAKLGSWADAMARVTESDPAAAALMKSMQADYTRKTQEASQLRKDALRERAAFLKGKEAIKAKEELPEYDPWTESTVTARIESEVATRLNALLEPMKQEYQTLAAEESYNTFVDHHADFTSDTELRSEVQVLLEASPSLDLETAYWAAKGKRAKGEREAATAQVRAEREARKEAALRGTSAARKGGRTAAPPKADLKKMTSSDILALAKALHGQ